MADYFNIAIIGSGNLAWHLAPELENAGHKIVQLCSRNTKNAKLLQRRLYNAEVSRSLNFSDSNIEIIMLCVSDDAIEEVSREIILPDHAVVVHTSGSQSIVSLGYAATENVGVFYPVQTFTKNKSASFEDIPILIEAENKQALKALQRLGKSISKYVKHVTSKDRLAIHVAAVFACNFTNQLLRISEEILNDRGFDFKILHPLIAETINKSLEIGPAKSQTGPAARGDLETLDKHMEFLKGGEYQKIYKLVSNLILNK